MNEIKNEHETDIAAQLDMLTDENKRLRSELEKALAKNTADEFSQLYPDADRSKLPIEVTEMTDSGIPLAAAYALSERRAYVAKMNAELANAENSRKSAGGVGTGDSGNELTVEQIKKMPQSAVRKYYSQIMNTLGRSNI